MSDRVVIVDYGMGNVLSVSRAVECCGAQVVLTSDAETILHADRLILPGVGAFGDCMGALHEGGLIEPILTFVKTGHPFLGICVGMQILLGYGEEFGGAAGLGLIPGSVTQIPMRSDEYTRKIPHIGWTPISPSHNDSLQWHASILDGTVPSTPFYFVHSFTARPKDPAHVLAVADYAGAAVTAAVRRDNVTGVQFHPEKSGRAGLAVLAKFLRCG